MASPVKAKKHLGQHFLIDLNIAQKIVNALPQDELITIEIGPGTGVLTQYMIDKDNFIRKKLREWFKKSDLKEELIAKLWHPKNYKKFKYFEKILVSEGSPLLAPKSQKRPSILVLE